MEQLSLHLKLFNDKIKAMNQTNSKTLTLTSLEARNLHNDIFLLLAQISSLAQDNSAEVKNTIDLDGGSFK